MFKSAVGNYPIPNQTLATFQQNSASSAKSHKRQPVVKPVDIRPQCEVPLLNTAWLPWIHHVATSATTQTAQRRLGDLGVSELQSLELISSLLVASNSPATAAAPPEPEGTFYETASGDPLASFEGLFPQASQALKNSTSLQNQLKLAKSFKEILTCFSNSFTALSDTVMPRQERNIKSCASYNSDYTGMYTDIQNLPAGAVSLLGYSVRSNNGVQSHALVVFKSQGGVNIIDTNVGDHCTLNQYSMKAEKLYKDNPDGYAEFMKSLCRDRFGLGDLKVETMTLITYGDQIPQARLTTVPQARGEALQDMAKKHLTR